MQNPGSPATSIGTIAGITNSIQVHILSTAGTMAVNIGKTDGTITVRTDPGYELGSIRGINSSINVHVGSTGGTLRVGDIPGTIAVFFSPANPAVAATFSGSIAAVPTSGSGSALYDETADATRVLISGSHAAASLEIKGTLTGITNSIAVHVGSTGGTLRIGDIPGTVAVFFSPANPAVAATFSGTIAAVPTTGSGDPIYEETGNWTRVLIAGSQAAASIQVRGITDSINVYIGGTAGTLRMGDIPGTVAVFFSPANPAVNIGSSSISINPFTPAGTSMSDEGFDAQRVIIAGSHASASLEVKGTLTGITNSISTYLSGTAGTLGVRVGQVDGTVAVYFSPANPAVAATFSGTIGAVPTTGSGDPIYEETGNWTRVSIAGSQVAASLLISGQQAAGTNRPFIVNTDGAIKVYDIVTGTISTVAAVTNITNSIAVHVLSTGGTMAVNVGKVDGTVYVGFSPASPAVKDIASTLVLGDVGGVASGTAIGVSVSGNTIISPVASRVNKIYAIALTTTAQVHLVARFTNGAGTGPTEYWRYAFQAPSAGIAGANIAVTPPAYLFAQASGATLSLVLDTASRIHYSVAYFRESA